MIEINDKIKGLELKESNMITFGALICWESYSCRDFNICFPTEEELDKAFESIKAGNGIEVDFNEKRIYPVRVVKVKYLGQAKISLENFYKVNEEKVIIS